MPTIVALSGSLRKASYNSALLRACAEVAPAGTNLDIRSIRDVPLYDGDLDAQGTPAAVAALKDAVAAADGLLLASPEYNHSVPGTLKNAIDWMSRPARDIARVFGDKPVGLIGASGGMSGTRFAQVAWLPVLRVLGTRPYFGRQIYVAGASKVFDADLRLVDEATRTHLTAFMADFVAFVEASKR